jgi:hypothetical protein
VLHVSEVVGAIRAGMDANIIKDSPSGECIPDGLNGSGAWTIP